MTPAASASWQHAMLWLPIGLFASGFNACMLLTIAVPAQQMALGTVLA